MALLRRASLMIAGAAALPLVLAPTVSAADDEPAGTPNPPCLLPYLDGSDVDIVKELIKEALDVDDDVFVWDMPAVRVLWLDLSTSECEEINEAGLEGVSGAVVAGSVSINPDPFANGTAYWPFTPAPDGLEGESFTGGQIVPTGYQRVGAEAGDFSDVDVAVVDTGVDQFHDDLNVVGGFNCTDPQNGDDNWGHDGYGHGTHVAGIIAALDNDRGVVGVAAGARIWSVKVLGDDGSGSFASVLCGIDWVAQHANTIEIANLSLGGQIPPTPLWGSDPVHNGFGITAGLGPIIVVSAGNSGIDSINSSPANYAESVVTVSALTDYDGLPDSLSAPNGGIPAEYRDDHRALFSNYGSVVDFIAPGVDILSTTPLNTYGRASGTSMAAPEVAGVLAAWAAANPRYARFAFEAVHEWSSAQGWAVRSGWEGDIGPDHEPLVRFGAPAPTPEQIAVWEEEQS
jgi:subtilisin family serine protease